MIQRYEVNSESYITDVPGPNRWCKSEDVSALESLLEEAVGALEYIREIREAGYAIIDWSECEKIIARAREVLK